MNFHFHFWFSFWDMKIFWYYILFSCLNVRHQNIFLKFFQIFDFLFSFLVSHFETWKFFDIIYYFRVSHWDTKICFVLVLPKPLTSALSRHGVAAKAKLRFEMTRDRFRPGAKKKNSCLKVRHEMKLVANSNMMNNIWCLKLRHENAYFVSQNETSKGCETPKHV